jgi:hypothetical protein
VYDQAVSQDTNVAFTHWRSNITPQGSASPFTIEGIEVDIFGNDGRIKDIWLFRWVGGRRGGQQGHVHGAAAALIFTTLTITYGLQLFSNTC